MKKNLLYLFFLIGLTASANNVTVPDSNFEDKLKNEENSSATKFVNPCTLNVIIGGTLDMPTSTFFVDEEVLNGTAPYNYLLDGSPSPNGKMFYASTLNPGIHTVVVQDANGCTGLGTFIVEKLPLSITATSKNPNCIESGSIICATTGGVGPYMYDVSLNGGPYTLCSETFTIQIGGHYQIRVMDAIGTTSSTIVELISPTPPSVTTTHTNVTCLGQSDGTITVTASGSGPCAFSINGGAYQSTPIFTGLSAGTYYITARDTNACISEAIAVTIGEPTALTASAIITKSLDCTSGATFVCAATGGSGVYVYSINGAAYSPSSSFITTIAGTYTIFVKDATFGCVTNTVVNIEPLSPLSPTITATHITCNGLNDGSITIIASGGSAPYMFSIDNGVTFQTSPVYNNLSAGTYNVIVKDANGCNYIETIIITEPETLSATVSIENQTITVTASGGREGYTYSFDGVTFTSANLFTIGNNYGSYQIYVKDSNNCVLDIMVTIYPEAPLLNGEKTLDIQFTLGQTLADIIVDGQNIKWYSSDSNTNSKTKAPEPTLPLSTPLVDNTTYYASQTINGYESTQRLAVTARLSLSTADFVLPDFKFYPNPVKNSLTISNTSAIEEVILISVKGDIVLTKQINSTEAKIDLSALSKGLYFLKVKAERTEKTIKIIKE